MTPSFSQVASDLQLKPEQVGGALEIFAFDMLIQNVDRSCGKHGGKSNLLTDGTRFCMIDHEKAFSFLDLIGTSPLPWELRNQAWVSDHLLFGQLRRHARSGVSFDSFLAKLSQLSDDCLGHAVNGVPPAWDDGISISRMIEHIRVVRNNMPLFERGLREALA